MTEAQATEVRTLARSLERETHRMYDSTKPEYEFDFDQSLENLESLLKVGRQIQSRL